MARMCERRRRRRVRRRRPEARPTRRWSSTGRVAALHVAGVPLDWAAYESPWRHRPLDLAGVPVRAPAVLAPTGRARSAPRPAARQCVQLHRRRRSRTPTALAAARTGRSSSASCRRRRPGLAGRPRHLRHGDRAGDGVPRADAPRRRGRRRRRRPGRRPHRRAARPARRRRHGACRRSWTTTATVEVHADAGTRLAAPCRRRRGRARRDGDADGDRWTEAAMCVGSARCDTDDRRRRLLPHAARTSASTTARRSACIERARRRDGEVVGTLLRPGDADDGAIHPGAGRQLPAAPRPGHAPRPRDHGDAFVPVARRAVARRRRGHGQR